MTKISQLIAGALFSICLAAVPARALSNHTYVSGKGADKGGCTTPATACRTFAFAIAQTADSGEIIAIDPANYGPVTITKIADFTEVPSRAISGHRASAVEVPAAIQIGNRVLETLDPNSIFGEMALIDAAPRNATAIAAINVILVPITEKQFLFLVSQTPFFALKVMRRLTRRLRTAL